MNERTARWWAELPPAAGAAVMAAGIISVGFQLTGHEVLSRTLLAFAGALWLLLAFDFATRLLRSRRRWVTEADTPPALTAVAATTVLGVRVALLGWTTPAAVLLVVSAVLWAVLLTAVLRHLRAGMPGGVFLICVATEALAVLGAALTPSAGDWLARTALVFFLLGLLLYLAALLRFDFRQVVEGAGDQWVAGGAMAISALAGSKLLATGVWTGVTHTSLRNTTVFLLSVDLVWYVVLVVGELLRPRLGYDVRRWATVFPMGMTATACLSTSAAAAIVWLDGFGEALLWIASAAWVVTLVGTIRTIPRRRPAAARGA
ncbi:tellurite resistance/C4-dicarboxylate transporter family protein [Streptomyces sp. Je 1-79]|uniref:tellurite resistance/C4-dicarboxylate transporter family protein n=1 Tax=Streptomyces sp. Je 1-79 TaxID=2943847 RepID=UPI0021A308B8|nr:tellurite resistance/C4-dicarboxylate transporter family protein [Streptomyces sp. Je 1-79]MCT4351985.1 tellurite resistance/C4-dicarboxylate transporter family protein [Streptomyces sp. Je 1-79]